MSANPIENVPQRLLTSPQIAARVGYRARTQKLYMNLRAGRVKPDYLDGFGRALFTESRLEEIRQLLSTPELFA
jgi:hypothetical protein